MPAKGKAAAAKEPKAKKDSEKAEPVKETPKAEAPKAEAPKAEAPKTEAPKTEAKEVKHPLCKWAESNDAIFLTVEVSDCKNPTIKITDKGVLFECNGYKADLQLKKEIKPDDANTKFGVTDREVTFHLVQRTVLVVSTILPPSGEERRRAVERSLSQQGLREELDQTGLRQVD